MAAVVGYGQPVIANLLAFLFMRRDAEPDRWPGSTMESSPDFAIATVSRSARLPPRWGRLGR